MCPLARDDPVRDREYPSRRVGKVGYVRGERGSSRSGKDAWRLSKANRSSGLPVAAAGRGFGVRIERLADAAIPDRGALVVHRSQRIRRCPSARRQVSTRPTSTKYGNSPHIGGSPSVDRRPCIHGRPRTEDWRRRLRKRSPSRRANVPQSAVVSASCSRLRHEIGVESLLQGCRPRRTRAAPRRPSQ